MRFLYILDPMCAWCYGFQPELERFLAQHPSLDIDWIMGGLAPDNKQPMEPSLMRTIATYWHQIEQRTQVTFNHDYWELNTPYRSTYHACRAVIAAQSLKDKCAQPMVKAIQSAYYQQAQNPSLEGTLVACANSLGLDKSQFLAVLNSNETESQLQQHLDITRQLQVSGFPALFFISDANQLFPLALGFCQAEDLDERFNKVIAGI
ncbi:DsbA family protein [Pseudoalteromonas luteoviolacea]|uniref:DSBA-like thioredoxin domain-containing protein n=1 Tax=Pseudoalteromonas luteoviolacea (strain 2ta16) TaxID=1353533 RepID=V4HQW7_PSEL2|nr:DsbA family protein [Pseudoalteromonas luteoviolacea]ESP92193.1 putative protein-disulfide isomerase [Pseudoalteromonas luteoviolacea 2ta16]KZN29300.1 hypothetical protein N483_07650 [Pseudoalteromonas luteoviolacea NCIMB 1944]